MFFPEQHTYIHTSHHLELVALIEDQASSREYSALNFLPMQLGCINR